MKNEPKDKVVVAVFAHPDDEAFGPGGTLAKLAQQNTVYLITVTGGEAGDCSIDDHNTPLFNIRHKELISSARILGIKKVFCLGFEDGTLSNNTYHELASKIEKKLHLLQPNILITFETNGISGHLDHIAVSLVTTYLHERKKYGQELWYYCISTQLQKSQSKDYFIYFPQGHDPHEADVTIDVESVWEKRISALHAHASQKHDGDKILATLQSLSKEEYFQIFKD